MRVKGVGIGRVQHKVQKLGRLHNGLLPRATVASHLFVLLAAAEQQLVNKRTPSASPRLSITVSVASHTQGEWHVENCICILHHCDWMEMFWVTVSVPLLIWLWLPERTLRARHRLADIYFTQVLSISLTLMLYLYKAVVKSRIPPRTVIAGFDMCVTFLATCTFLVATRQKLGEWNVIVDSACFPWLFLLLQIQTSLPADPLCLLLWTRSQTCTHTHIHMSALAVGDASVVTESETLTCPICLVWDRRVRVITWRIIAGDKLPPQKWLHWFGQSVCVRECNSDRSQHFTNGPSNHLNKTLCTGATLLGKAH